MKQKTGVAIQAPNLLEFKHPDCLECKEAIFNPICPSCISKQFYNWISISYPKIERKILKELNVFLKKNKHFHNKSQTCIVCKKQNAYVCPYCFTVYLKALLKSAQVTNKVLSEFLFLFNFDFEHTGYAKNGIEMPSWL
jgi:hypothetical protein